MKTRFPLFPAIIFTILLLNAMCLNAQGSHKLASPFVGQWRLISATYNDMEYAVPGTVKRFYPNGSFENVKQKEGKEFVDTKGIFFSNDSIYVEKIESSAQSLASKISNTFSYNIQHTTLTLDGYCLFPNAMNGFVTIKIKEIWEKVSSK